MKTTLIVATYNRADFLEAVLASVARQTCMGLEVLIAEDASFPEIARVVRETRSGGFPFPLLHISQEDKGFRKNTCLNRAVKEASGELLVFIDGDCLLHPEFISQYEENAEKGVLLAGRRVELDLTTSDAFLKTKDPKLLSLFSLWRNGSEHLEQGIFLPLFNRKVRTLLGSNMGILKEDLTEKLNGFDEDYERPTVGEDDDIEWRARKAGMTMRSMKFKALQYHLFHTKSYNAEDYAYNKALLDAKEAAGNAFCDNGLKKKEAR